MSFDYPTDDQRVSKVMIYHLRAVADAPDGNAAAMTRLQDLIVSFAVQAVGMKVPSPDEIEKGFQYADEESKSCCECVAIPDRMLWTIRFQYPGKQGETEFLWFADVAIEEIDGTLEFGLKLEVSRGVDVKEVQQSIPLVELLVEQGELRQYFPLKENLWRINLPSEIPDFIRFLESPERHQMVIVISAVNRNQWNFTQTAPLYLINAEYLAAHTVGFAYVVQLGYAAAYEFSNTVGRNWAVFDGAVRCYLPYLSFKESNPRDHRSKLKGEIWFWTFNNQTGSSVYTSFLIDSARYWQPRNRIRMDGMHFLPDARVMASEIEMAGVAQLKDPGERESAYLRTIDALRHKLAIAEKECEQLSAALARAEETSTYFQKESASFRTQLEAQRGRNRDRGRWEKAPASLPESFRGLESWVEQNLAGKVLLLPGVAEAAEKSEFIDVPSAYRALQLLGNEYRSSRMGQGSLEAFQEALRNCGMSFSSTFDEERIGEDRKALFVDYPAGSGQETLLRFQIAKGDSHDPRYDLRIYFFWDPESDQVVVGSLPGDLKTAER